MLMLGSELSTPLSNLITHFFFKFSDCQFFFPVALSTNIHKLSCFQQQKTIFPHIFRGHSTMSKGLQSQAF